MILMKLCTEIRYAHEGIWGLWVWYCFIWILNQMHEGKGFTHCIYGNGVKLGIWEFYGVYIIHMSCCNVCKLIWYE